MSRIDLRSAIRLNSENATFTIQRSNGGSRGDSGRWQENARTAVTGIHGSVQQLNGEDRKMLPEGARTDDSFVLYLYEKDVLTTTRLGQKSGDVVVPDAPYKSAGENFDVYNVTDWSTDLGLYQRALCVRVQQ